MEPQSLSSPPRRSRGYVLLTVLVLGTVVALFAVTYSRHVVVADRTTSASWTLLDVGERAHSGLAFARQALAAELPVPPCLDASGPCPTSLLVADLADGRKAIDVAATLPDGSGARKLAEAALLAQSQQAPGEPDALPRLSASKASSLLADPEVAKIHYSGPTSVSNTELSGLLVIHAGATLTLSEVVLTGAIVSEAALDDEPFGEFDAATAPSLVLAGDVRIDTEPFLPGVAIVMPDGVVASSGSPHLQLGGDVVAHDLALGGPGAVHGRLLSVSAAQLDAGLEQLGVGRKEPEWSSDLQLQGSWRPEFLAFVPHQPSLDQVQAIVEYWSP